MLRRVQAQSFANALPFRPRLLKVVHATPAAAFIAGFVVFLLTLLASDLLYGADRPAQGGSREARVNESSSLQGLYPVWWGRAPIVPKTVPCKEPGKCVECHDTHANMDPSHAFSCVRCHGGNPSSDDKDEAHAGLMADPGDLRIAGKTCGKCHQDEVKRVTLSPMGLAPRMINHTRFAFGGQKSPQPVYGVVALGGLEQVPHPALSDNLGDDLLRRSCLRCHLYTRGSSRPGEHRGQGCSACHVLYPNSSDGKPTLHALVRSVGMTACLKCHNSNHVGADFVGLFEKDFNRGFRSPFVKGRQPPRIYGSEQHRLSRDVHFDAGMECMDCHTLDEVHGHGEVSKSPNNSVAITCEGCHVWQDHPAILKDEKGKITLLRGEGRTVPAWNENAIPHKIAPHREKVRCSACHAAWSFQDYGLHLMLEERADYWKWAPNAAQNDPQVQELLLRNVGTYAELVPAPDGAVVPPRPMEEWKLPATTDWLTGESRPGAWFRGLTARRWEHPPLGVDGKGRVSIMRPMYQYVISHVDADGNLLMDRQIPTTGGDFPALIFNPYTPHTTMKAGRPCHECHGSHKAAGRGEGLTGIQKPEFSSVWMPEEKVPDHRFVWDALVNEKGEPLQRSTHPSAGPLDPETIRRLLKPSEQHRAFWYRYLKGADKSGTETTR